MQFIYYYYLYSWGTIRRGGERRHLLQCPLLWFVEILSNDGSCFASEVAAQFE